MTETQKTKIRDWIDGSIFNENNLLNDPWGGAKLFLETVQASSEFVVANDHAFSIVLSQAFAIMYGRVCVVDSSYYYSTTDYATQLVLTANPYGNFILFQTR